jgi:hypothetical protein
MYAEWFNSIQNIKTTGRRRGRGGGVTHQNQGWGVYVVGMEVYTVHILVKQIRIRILLLIKVMGILHYWPKDPAGLHFESPGLHFERPRPSTALFWASKASGSIFLL